MRERLRQTFSKIQEVNTTTTVNQEAHLTELTCNEKNMSPNKQTSDGKNNLFTLEDIKIMHNEMVKISSRGVGPPQLTQCHAV